MESNICNSRGVISSKAVRRESGQAGRIGVQRQDHSSLSSPHSLMSVAFAGPTKEATCGDISGKVVRSHHRGRLCKKSVWAVPGLVMPSLINRCRKVPRGSGKGHWKEAEITQGLGESRDEMKPMLSI